jgi:hypothetical protein
MQCGHEAVVLDDLSGGCRENAGKLKKAGPKTT